MDFYYVGHLSLAFRSEVFFFCGLLLIVLGVGLLKPNISCLVGSLYKDGDVRRDQGFTIFYIGINIGAFLASIFVGYIMKIMVAFRFSLAGFGMILGQWVFFKWKKKLKKVLRKFSQKKN